MIHFRNRIKSNNHENENWFDIHNYSIWCPEDTGGPSYQTNFPFQNSKSENGGKIICNYNFSNQTKVISMVTEISIAGNGFYLSYDEKWHDFKNKPVSFGPWGARWFMIEKNDGSFFSCLDTNYIDVLEYRKIRNRCFIKIYWLDAMAHPLIYYEPGIGEMKRNWEFREGAFGFELYWYNKDIRGLDIPSILPGSYQAAFVLTDHADFVAPETYLPIFYGDNANPGILSLGLTATVSLFCLADEQNKTYGLDKKEYREMADKLYKDGVEIASHSISAATGEDRTKEWFNVNIRYLQPYKPVTWIDHGSHICRADNLISLGWKIDSPYYRLDEVKEFGFQNIWSGNDMSVDPVGNIGLLSQKNAKPIQTVYKKSFKALKNSQYIIFIREIARFFFRYADPKTRNYMFDVMWRFSFITRGISIIKSFLQFLLYILRFILSFLFPPNIIKFFKNILSPCRSSECKIILYESNWYPGMICFNTIRINDLHDMLSDKSLNTLYLNHDIFIGHVYLGDNSPHHPQRAFIKSDGTICIDPKFSDGLSRLVEYYREGKIWVTTLKELANRWRTWRSIQFILDSDGRLEIRRPTNIDIVKL